MVRIVVVIVISIFILEFSIIFLRKTVVVLKAWRIFLQVDYFGPFHKIVGQPEESKNVECPHGGSEMIEQFLAQGMLVYNISLQTMQYNPFADIFFEMLYSSNVVVQSSKL